MISGANEMVFDTKVKTLFNQISSSIKLPDLTGYCVFATESYVKGPKEGREVASYRFEKR